MDFQENKQIKYIFTKLKRKLESRNITYVSDNDIYDEIEDAIEVVNDRRRFQSTPDFLFENKYKSLIIRLCIASITKWGAEGETSHSENNINRNYENGSQYPESMLSQIIPLAKAGK